VRHFLWQSRNPDRELAFLIENAFEWNLCSGKEVQVAYVLIKALSLMPIVGYCGVKLH